MDRKFIGLIRDSFIDFLRNPVLIFFGLLLWAFVFVFGKISAAVNHSLSNSLAITGWLVFFMVFVLLFFAFVFSGMISVVVNGWKAGDFLKGGKKFWFRNFWIVLLIVAVSTLIGRVAHYGALIVGIVFNLTTGWAQFLMILIYFAGLIGVLIFMTFSSFCLVIYDLSIWKSVKKSMKLVKRGYLETLAVSVLIFVLLFFVNKLPNVLAEFAEYGLVVPFMIILFSKFVLELASVKRR